MKALFFIALLFSFFILPSLVNATAIGISPRKLIFNEGDNEKQVMLFNPNSNKVKYAIHAEKGEFIKLPKNGEIKAEGKAKLIIIRNKEQHTEEENDTITITFYEDKKGSLNIITSASIEVVLKKDTSDMLSLKEGSENKGLLEGKGIFSIASILTIIAIAIIIGVFVWMMVFG